MGKRRFRTSENLLIAVLFTAILGGVTNKRPIRQSGRFKEFQNFVGRVLVPAFVDNQALVAPDNGFFSPMAKIHFIQNQCVGIVFPHGAETIAPMDCRLFCHLKAYGGIGGKGGENTRLYYEARGWV